MSLPRAWTIALLSLVLATASAHAAARVEPPRAGQVGLGLQLSYGSLLKSGDTGNEFGSGGSYAVRVRYRMRYQRAIGFSFEAHHYDVREPQPYVAGQDSTILPDRLDTSLAGLDFYQMFGTRTANVSYVLVSGGVAIERVALNDGETEISGKFSGDGLYVGVGGGLERFVWRAVALDASARYYGIFREGRPHQSVQAQLGFIFYAGY
jgi:hypothetical protein